MPDDSQRGRPLCGIDGDNDLGHDRTQQLLTFPRYRRWRIEHPALLCAATGAATAARRRAATAAPPGQCPIQRNTVAIASTSASSGVITTAFQLHLVTQPVPDCAVR